MVKVYLTQHVDVNVWLVLNLFRKIQINRIYQKTYPVMVRDDEDCVVGSLGQEDGLIGAVKE